MRKHLQEATPAEVTAYFEQIQDYRGDQEKEIVGPRKHKRPGAPAEAWFFKQKVPTALKEVMRQYRAEVQQVFEEVQRLLKQEIPAEELPEEEQQDFMQYI